MCFMILLCSFPAMASAMIAVKTKNYFLSWVISCAVIPLILLIIYSFCRIFNIHTGDNSSWPIALGVVVVLGALSGAFGSMIVYLAEKNSSSA